MPYNKYFWSGFCSFALFFLCLFSTIGNKLCDFNMLPSFSLFPFWFFLLSLTLSCYLLLRIDKNPRANKKKLTNKAIPMSRGEINLFFFSFGVLLIISGIVAFCQVIKLPLEEQLNHHWLFGGPYLAGGMILIALGGLRNRRLNKKDANKYVPGITQLSRHIYMLR